MTDETHVHAFDFSAMNTRIEVTLEQPAQQSQLSEAVKRIQNWFERVEQRFSRFLPTSELSHINRHSGKKTMISSSMTEVLTLTDTYRTITSGIFSPFVLEALQLSGYNRTFDQVKASPLVTAHPPRLHDDAMMLDVIMRSVQLSEGTQIDLGGIVKGWSVSRLCAWLRKEYGIERGFVNAGGDLQAWGGSSREEPWLIGIADPHREDEEIAMLSLIDGSVATSNVVGRRWQSSQGEMHHLINPRSMQPSQSDVIQCTTVGPDIVECEVWAKVICILGLDESIPLLKKKAPYIDALAVTRPGHFHFAGNEKRYRDQWQCSTVDFFHV